MKPKGSLSGAVFHLLAVNDWQCDGLWTCEAAWSAEAQWFFGWWSQWSKEERWVCPAISLTPHIKACMSNCLMLQNLTADTTRCPTDKISAFPLIMNKSPTKEISTSQYTTYVVAVFPWILLTWWLFYLQKPSVSKNYLFLLDQTEINLLNISLDNRQLFPLETLVFFILVSTLHITMIK